MQFVIDPLQHTQIKERFTINRFLFGFGISICSCCHKISCCKPLSRCHNFSKKIIIPIPNKKVFIMLKLNIYPASIHIVSDVTAASR